MLYVVTIDHGDGLTEPVEVDARTPHLAVGLAERIARGRAITVSTTYHVVGRCGRCGTILFEGDANRGKRGALWCQEC